MALGRKPGGTKRRGRTKIGGNEAIIGNRAPVELEKRTEVTRPVTPGGGKNRGDRRDTSRAYAGNSKRRPNHANPAGRSGQRRSS